MLTPGKQFEADFKNSIPKDCYHYKPTDSAVGFDIEHSTQRFSRESPYDLIICRNGQMYGFELKSNKEKRMSFSGKTPRIKPKQVEELLKAENAGAKAGLVLNFRTYEKTYFIKASVFKRFMDTSGKKSVNLNDAEEMGMEIPFRLLKVHYRYDLEELLTPPLK